jgi:hypothetical protein
MSKTIRALIVLAVVSVAAILTPTAFCGDEHGGFDR